MSEVKNLEHGFSNLKVLIIDDVNAPNELDVARLSPFITVDYVSSIAAISDRFTGEAHVSAFHRGSRSVGGSVRPYCYGSAPFDLILADFNLSENRFGLSGDAESAQMVVAAGYFGAVLLALHFPGHPCLIVPYSADTERARNEVSLLKLMTPASISVLPAPTEAKVDAFKLTLDSITKFREFLFKSIELGSVKVRAESLRECIDLIAQVDTVEAIDARLELVVSGTQRLIPLKSLFSDFILGGDKGQLLSAIAAYLDRVESVVTASKAAVARKLADDWIDELIRSKALADFRYRVHQLWEDEIRPIPGDDDYTKVRRAAKDLIEGGFGFKRLDSESLRQASKDHIFKFLKKRRVTDSGIVRLVCCMVILRGHEVVPLDWHESRAVWVQRILDPLPDTEDWFHKKFAGRLEQNSAVGRFAERNFGFDCLAEFWDGERSKKSPLALTQEEIDVLCDLATDMGLQLWKYPNWLLRPLGYE